MKGMPQLNVPLVIRTVNRVLGIAVLGYLISIIVLRDEWDYQSIGATALVVLIGLTACASIYWTMHERKCFSGAMGRTHALNSTIFRRRLVTEQGMADGVAS